jgi:hypothetical protein
VRNAPVPGGVFTTEGPDGTQHSHAGGNVNQHTWRLAAAILAPFLAAACASTTLTSGGARAKTPATGVPPPATPTAGPAATGPPTASTSTSTPCQARSLALGYGPQMSPATGEHGDTYLLTNRGPADCTLTGYPRITLYAPDGARLPFHYIHRHSPYVTSAPPGTVVLQPGASAYILAAKYRCDRGDDQDAATIRITIPGPRHGAVTGRAAPDASGVSALTYCRGGPNSPGQIIAVSPIEPTRQATIPNTPG